MTSRLSLLQSSPAPTGSEALTVRFKHFSVLPRQSRIDEARRMLLHELDLPEPEHRKRVAARLMSWLALEPSELETVIDAFAFAREELDAADVSDLSEEERVCLLDGMSFSDCQRLAANVPWLSDLANSSGDPGPSSAYPIAAMVALATH